MPRCLQRRHLESVTDALKFADERGCMPTSVRSSAAKRSERSPSPSPNASTANTSRSSRQRPSPPSRTWRSRRILTSPNRASVSLSRTGARRLQLELRAVQANKRGRDFEPEADGPQRQPVGHHQEHPLTFLLRVLARGGREAHGIEPDAGNAGAFSVSARRTPSIQGAPICSNGVSVPRPTEMFVPSIAPMPGYTVAWIRLRMFGDGLIQEGPVSSNQSSRDPSSSSG